MPRYSSSDNIYPEHAPYQPSRSALRRRFGNRAIVSHGPADSGRPGSESVRDRMGFTDEGTWRAFFSPRMPAASPTRAPAQPPTPVPAPSTFYNEQNPFGTTLPSVVTSGTNFVNKFGWGGVRSTADMKAGRNAPQNLSAWDAYLKSPAPAAPPQTSLDLLPAPRAGSPLVMRPSEFSATPTADSAFSPQPLTLSRLAKRSPWDEPI